MDTLSLASCGMSRYTPCFKSTVGSGLSEQSAAAGGPPSLAGTSGGPGAPQHSFGSGKKGQPTGLRV